MMNKHLIVVSVDALVFEDLEYAKTLPTFKKIIENGACIQKVKTIYPSLTHPVHASIMSGCAAGKTGIIANEEFMPGVIERTWFNHLNQVQCETIFHVAHQAGLTTAACRWPLTASGNDVIDYLIPEVMGLDMRGNENDPISVYRKLGTTECLIDVIEDALQKYGTTNNHPDYDEFEIVCAAEIIRRYKPNLLFTHPGYVDGERHRTGLFSQQVNESIKVTDQWLLMLLDAVKDAGIEDCTDFVILSDHGHLNINRTICPNVFLKDAGLIKTDENGKLISWDAYCSTCALSNHVYLKDKDNIELYNKVYDLLQKMAKEKIYGFSEVLTREEVKSRYGLDGNFSFVLETDGFTTFSDDINRPVVRELDTSDYHFGHSTHGHMPEKGPQPVFIGMGPSFNKGVIVEHGHILNHAPTLAKIFNLELKEADGKPEYAILNKTEECY